MCPKKKSDHVQSIRFELQEREREALDMIAASITAKNVSGSAKNVTQSISNLITPFTQASVAGITFAITLAGMIGLVKKGHEDGIIGTDDSGAPISPEDIPPFFFGIIPGTTAYAIRNINWTQFQNEFDRRMRDINPPSI